MIRIFKVLIPARALVLFISDLVLTISFFLMAGLLSSEAFDLNIFLFYEGGLGRLSILVLSLLLAIYFHDLYTPPGIRSRRVLIQQFCQVIGIVVLLQGVLGYVNLQWIVPRSMAVIGSALCLAGLTAWRMIYSSLDWGGFGTQRVLFLGANPIVQEVAHRLQQGLDLGFTVIGYVDDHWQAGSLLKGTRVLGPVRALREIVAQTKPDRIVLGIAEWRKGLPLDALLEASSSGVVIEDPTAIYEEACQRFCISQLRPAQLIFSNELGSRPGSIALQSIYTNLTGVAALVLAAPLMILIGLAVKLSSAGPVFDSQKRIGFNGIPFTLFKFRCTTRDTEARRETALGRWLRRYALDALPQILNVVRGEMSWVGPRPERPEYVQVLSGLIPCYRQRHCVKPGIMGWSQINREHGAWLVDTVTRLEYDLYYIKNVSLSLDASIILNTLKAKFLSLSVA